MFPDPGLRCFERWLTVEVRWNIRLAFQPGLQWVRGVRLIRTFRFSVVLKDGRVRFLFKEV